MGLHKYHGGRFCCFLSLEPNWIALCPQLCGCFDHHQSSTQPAWCLWVSPSPSLPCCSCNYSPAMYQSMRFGPRFQFSGFFHSNIFGHRSSRGYSSRWARQLIQRRRLLSTSDRSLEWQTTCDTEWSRVGTYHFHLSSIRTRMLYYMNYALEQQ